MYEPIIGLEIHVQLATKSKMFCRCQNNPDAPPNTNICPICAGHPGVLPVANQKAVEYAIKTGLALNCQIASVSKFDRKNYFYPDLPKGYQISQFDEPFCRKGYLEIEVNGEYKKFNLERIHLEEDAGKLIHETNGKASLVDLNRAGTPLLEIVTKPDFRSAKEAKFFLQELRKIVRYIGISGADMERGQMRADANVSLRPKGEWKMYPKTEIKNMNSFKAVKLALDFEIKRQEKLWQEKNPPKFSTTRFWDDEKEATFEIRVKEEAHDYRYFPEPDLPPFSFSDKKIKELYDSLPELPQTKRKRFKKGFGLNDKEVFLITQEMVRADFFENMSSELVEWVKSLELKEELREEKKKEIIQLATGWFTSKLFALLNETKTEMKDCKISPENFAEFVAMLYEGKINSKIGMEVLTEMFRVGADPSQVVEARGLSQVSESPELEKFAERVIKENPKAVADFREGKENALQFLMGAVMKKTKGRANPKKVIEILRKKLK